MTSRTFLSQRILQNATVANLTWQPDTIRFDDFLGRSSRISMSRANASYGLPAPKLLISIHWLFLIGEMEVLLKFSLLISNFVKFPWYLSISIPITNG